MTRIKNKVAGGVLGGFCFLTSSGAGQAAQMQENIAAAYKDGSFERDFPEGAWKVIRSVTNLTNNDQQWLQNPSLKTSPRG